MLQQSADPPFVSDHYDPWQENRKPHGRRQEEPLRQRPRSDHASSEGSQGLWNNGTPRKEPVVFGGLA